eukprot:COSAG06_NODE_57287_length_281_cov_0.483516_1_plen_61_part_10
MATTHRSGWERTTSLKHGTFAKTGSGQPYNVMDYNAMWKRRETHTAGSGVLHAGGAHLVDA